MTSVRLAAVADLDAVLRLEQGIATAPHWSEEQYAAILHAGDDGALRRCLFVATANERVVGFAVGMAIANASSELESVAVDALHRLGGVGRLLCEAVIAWCRGQGAKEIDLEVRATSAGAIALYRGLGFEASGHRLAYYSQPADDALLMRLDLAGS